HPSLDTSELLLDEASCIESSRQRSLCASPRELPRVLLWLVLQRPSIHRERFLSRLRRGQKRLKVRIRVSSMLSQRRFLLCRNRDVRLNGIFLLPVLRRLLFSSSQSEA